MSGTGRDADVIIVGDGPVGATLAVLLARAGWSVTVLERWPEPYPRPRAVHMDHQVARIFQACGLGDRLGELTEPAELYEWRNGAGTTLLRLGRAGLGGCGWPASLMFNQPALEALLDERAGALGVDVRRGEEVIGVAADATGVAVETAAGGRYAASYLVGCDGANSTVRQLAGLAVQDLGFSSDWLIVDVILRSPRRFDPVNLQVCDPGRPTTLVSGGPGRRRWEFMRLPGESLEELNSADRAWELLAAWDVEPATATLERHTVYTFNARFAEQWRAGRVLLAGDAAHLMPPFAGQGMCAGIRDAANLAWKLDVVLAGRTPDALLDDYATERRPEVRATIEFSIELGRIICVADPAEAAARDEAMAAAVGPEPSDAPALPVIEHGVVDSDSPAAGHVFPQGLVDGRRFDDVHGVGWRLVSLDGAPPLDADLTRWFASLGGRIIAVPADHPVYGRWFSEHRCRAALQRPDFHVYGTATGPDGMAPLLAGLRARLSHPGPSEGAPS